MIALLPARTLSPRMAALAVTAALVATAALLAVASPARALEFRAEIDRGSVPVGGQLTLRFILSGGQTDLPRLRAPAIDGFDTYSAGTSQSMAITNGSVEVTFTQTFILLAKREGRFTLGPFEFTHGGQKLTTESFAVEVVAAGRAPAPGEPRQSGRSRGERGAARENDFFVRAEIDKQDAYVNEQVTMTVKFYARVRLSKDPEYSPPAATGFWVEDLPPVRQYMEDVGGVQYLVNEVKSALFPTNAGELTIGPATVKVLRSAADNWRLRDPFQAFGQDPFALLDSGRPEVLTSKPLKLRVRPLPPAPGARATSGLVGNYSLSARLDKTRVEANQPVTLTLILAGDGNLSTAPEPSLTLPQGVRAYDSQSRVNSNKEGYRLRGERVVEKVLIPQSPGRLVIPPASIVVFDPRKGDYREISSDTLEIEVMPSSSPALAGDAERTVRRIGRDLRAIRKGDHVLAAPKRWLYASVGFWALQALPLGLFVVAHRLGRARLRIEGDEGLARATRARSHAAKRLRDARAALGAASSDRFFAALGRSMADFAADKLGISRHGLSRDEVVEALRTHGADDDLLRRFRELLERCDMGRFAPGGDDAAERSGLLERAEDLIVEMERVFRV